MRRRCGMLVELTAVYERHANGVRAYIAELEAVSTQAKTPEEARANLVARVRLFLEYERALAFAKAGADARMEPIRVELPTVQGLRAEAVAVCPLDEVRPYEEADLFQTLLEQGKIDTIPPPYPAGARREEHDPVQIEGKPISEEIIEGRR
jgi:hypothetical protein